MSKPIDPPLSRLFHPRRPLGRTGFTATRLGIGDVADRSVPLEQCVATVRRAMDAGLNVIDTAPGYENGYSEMILAQALKGRRREMFVIDKVDFPTQPVAPQVQESLKRLELDAVDAFLFHGVSSMDIWNQMAAPGGGLDQLDQQVQAGNARFRGISSHHPDVLRAAIDSGRCDILMFAIGPFCHERYVNEILPLTREKGIGTVCFKTFGAGKLVGDTQGYGRALEQRPRGKFSSGGKDANAPLLPHLTPRQCVQYTLTIDPDVALLGMSFPNEQDAAFHAALDFKPLAPEELAAARALAAEAVKDKGPCWWNP